MTKLIVYPVRVRAYLAWVFVCIVWGTTCLAIRMCLETVPPLLMGGLRFSIAGILLVAVLIARGEPLPRVRAWPPLAGLGALMLGCSNGGVVWAEQTQSPARRRRGGGARRNWLVKTDG